MVSLFNMYGLAKKIRYIINSKKIKSQKFLNEKI
tara:strand:- start:1282 stop:1383 length:102 start_codon:yes stop_codon:yes gene_type:complete